MVSFTYVVKQVFKITLAESCMGVDCTVTMCLIVVVAYVNAII